MRLIAAELLKMRRRTATWVVLGTTIVLTILLTSLVASDREVGVQLLSGPAFWSTVSDFPFGLLGSVMAIAYAAAIAGADWNWGVLRNVIARGESRVRYVLAKAVAIGLVLALGVAVVFLVAMLFGLLIAALQGVELGGQFEGDGIELMLRHLLFGYPALLERAAIGFAVAVVLRSQLAGVVVATLFYVGETIVTATMTLGSLADWMRRMVEGGDPPSPQWFQYLPFSIGDQVRAAGTAGMGRTEVPQLDVSAFLGQVPLAHGLIFLALYFAAAIALSVYRAAREEIVA